MFHPVSVGRVLTAFLLLFGLITILPAYLHAVNVSPVALYLSNQSRTGTLTLYNSGSRAEEIDISFAFGYPESDSNGEVSLALVHPDSVAAGEPSAAGWLRSFPRRVRLLPGQRQVVRVMATPPADLPVGEYWARVVVSSVGGDSPVEQLQSSSADASFHLQTRMVVLTALSYRNGPVETGVSVKSVEAVVADSSGAEQVELTIDLERQKNAAFLGSLVAELRDAEGRVLAVKEIGLAVYRDLRRKLSLAPSSGRVPEGARVWVGITTKREDLPPEALLGAESVEVEVLVE